MNTLTGPHNHWVCRGNCASKPLTLADRELITGRSIVVHDSDGGQFCGDCLADLPVSGYEALFHICGQAPEPAAGPEPDPEPAPAEVRVRARRPRKGDVVFYHGDVAEYRGVYEVVSARGGRLMLLDIDRALYNVQPSSVTIGGRVKRRRKPTKRQR